MPNRQNRNPFRHFQRKSFHAGKAEKPPRAEQAQGIGSRRRAWGVLVLPAGSWAVQEEAGTWWQLSSRAHATGELPSCQSLSRQEPALCPHQCLPLAGPGRKPGQGLRSAVCGAICGR